MNKCAILHFTDVPYAYAKDKDTLTLVVRTAKEDIKECKIFYKDRYDWTNKFKEEVMYKYSATKLFDYYKIDICVDRNRYRYYFKLTDYRGEYIFLDDRGLREKELEQSEATAFQYPYIALADVYQEEKWLQESVVYQIFVDRFNRNKEVNSQIKYKKWGENVSRSSVFGGNILGIVDKLDYLHKLGVDLLYLTPIFKSSSNHKYNTEDYYQIDPQFGTIEDAKKLVNECHKRDMKIVFDAVFNHSGDDFFAFKDLVVNGEDSQYKDWYMPDSLPIDKNKVNYYTFADNVKEMPKFNTSNSEVREYLLNVGAYWVEKVGIDGWRLDVSDEVDHDFWRAFKKRIKSINKNAIIVGEIMHEAGSFLKGDQMDSIMNYPFKGAMIDFFAKRSITVERFDDILAQNRVIYMNSITRQLWNLIGSHDTKRFLTEAFEDVNRMKLAIAFQFSYIGVPYIFYGDEIGLTGDEEPDSRKCMIWSEDNINLELYNLYKTMIKVRKENKALIYGEYKKIYCKDNVLVFYRIDAQEKILVAINNNDQSKNINIGIKTNTRNLMNCKKDELNGSIEIDSMGFKILKII